MDLLNLEPKHPLTTFVFLSIDFHSTHAASVRSRIVRNAILMSPADDVENKIDRLGGVSDIEK